MKLKHPLEPTIGSEKGIVTVNLPIWVVEYTNQLINLGYVVSRSELVRLALISYLDQVFLGQARAFLEIQTPEHADGIKSINGLKKLVKDARAEYKRKGVILHEDHARFPCDFPEGLE